MEERKDVILSRGRDSISGSSAVNICCFGFSLFVQGTIKKRRTVKPIAGSSSKIHFEDSSTRSKSAAPSLCRYEMVGGYRSSLSSSSFASLTWVVSEVF